MPRQNTPDLGRSQPVFEGEGSQNAPKNRCTGAGRIIPHIRELYLLYFRDEDLPQRLYFEQMSQVATTGLHHDYRRVA